MHFAYGLLLSVPAVRFAECLVNRAWSLVAGFGFILATSAVYEILEWGLAMVMAPDWAESYNGQQGDVWDAQRDMALAALGSLLAIAGLACVPSAAHLRKIGK